MDARQRLVEQLGGAPLVLGVAKAPQQADRGRLHVETLERRAQAVLVERPQHALGTGPLGHRHAQLGRHEGRRVPRAEPVQLRARLAAELLQVGEALSREQGGARHATLEQRVRAHGHPVHEALHVGGCGTGGRERLVHRVHHALRLVAGRRRRLARDEPVAGEQRGVGEGAADVHPEDHGVEATTSGV